MCVFDSCPFSIAADRSICALSFISFVSFTLFDPFWAGGCGHLLFFDRFFSLSITFPYSLDVERSNSFSSTDKWRMAIRGIDGWGRQSVILQLLSLCLCGDGSIFFISLSLVVVTPIKRNGRDSVLVVVQLFLFIFFFFVLFG